MPGSMASFQVRVNSNASAREPTCSSTLDSRFLKGMTGEGLGVRTGPESATLQTDSYQGYRKRAGWRWQRRIIAPVGPNCASLISSPPGLRRGAYRDKRVVLSAFDGPRHEFGIESNPVEQS